ncbi:AAEL017294-PA [Aedes aegypti]|uniref:Odorant receptor n=2 Tax=Aedes aegypti TaxID=7159 RepID=J9HID6_AEDAE|nr:odorant receptor 43 [Aedes aegypti]EJY57634.1 AAEL017294-PA [Aedes aegypti]DAA80385.1 TPA_exp: odorant receptor 43 [Aedes aegypti]
MNQFQKSYELYDYNLIFIRRLADVCGLDIMAKNYTFNFRTLLILILTIVSTASVLHSYVFYYQNWFRILETTVLISLIMQAIVKLYNAYIHRHFYETMYDRLRDFHYKYRNHKNHEQLLLVMEKIHMVTKAFFASYIVTGCCFFVFPVYVYLTERRRELLISIRIPYIDADSVSGYVVTMCFQSSLLVTFVIGFTAADSVILLFVCSLIAIVDVFTYDLRELTAMLNETYPNRFAIRKRMRQLFMQQLEIIEYESDLDERYFVSYFIQILSGVMGITITLFLIYKANYVQGCALLLSLFGQLLEMCLLGTIFSIKNEEITEAFYGMDWYLMDILEQKCIALMLHKSQHFVQMTVGGLRPLNMETFIVIIKSIYTYLMMLITVFK